MARGKFITLEGGEGAGKSTQVIRLAEFLRKQGHEVVETREVGGPAAAEEIRKLWLSQGEGHWDALTEVLLIFAARREHLVRTIWPALERGAWVVSDRFADSTRVYQGVGLGLGLQKIEDFYREVAGDFEPDLTLLLDLPVEIGRSRVLARGGLDDRYQRKDLSFHQILRGGYLALAEKYAHRFKLIDAGDAPEIVAKKIEATVQTHFVTNNSNG